MSTSFPVIFYPVLVIAAASLTPLGATLTALSIVGLGGLLVAYDASIGRPIDETGLLVHASALAVLATMAITTVSRQDRTVQMAGQQAAERAAALRQLTTARAAQSEILEALPDPVLVTDARGAVTYANSAARDYLDADTIASALPATADSPTRLRTQLPTRLGMRPVQLLVAPLVLGEERVRIWSITDLSARIRADAEHARALQLAEEANAQKSRFLANMSHELRTPLNAIIGYAELLLDDTEPPISVDLGHIHQAANHLLALINDVLDLSRVEAGRLVLYAEDVDVDEAISQVITQLKPSFETNSNTLTVHKPPLGRWRLDGLRLRQVITNLLSNAAKFTKNGAVTVHVGVQEQAGTSLLTVKVTDTGIGMDVEQMSRLFKPFAQADDSTSRRFGGSGLGLVLCKHFVDLMGGALMLDSRPGEGTWVQVVLPLEAARHLEPRREIASS
jgi:signal transduction histidine kinase